MCEIKETKVTGYYWRCKDCGKTIGPALTKKRVDSLKKQHIDLVHVVADEGGDE